VDADEPTLVGDLSAAGGGLTAPAAGGWASAVIDCITRSAAMLKNINRPKFKAKIPRL